MSESTETTEAPAIPDRHFNSQPVVPGSGKGPIKQPIAQAEVGPPPSRPSSADTAGEASRRSETLERVGLSRNVTMVTPRD